MEPNARQHLLLVEDNRADAFLAQEAMVQIDGATAWQFTHVERLHQAVEFLKKHSVDVILLDLSLPDSTGLHTLERIMCVAGQQPIIVFTGIDDEQIGIESVRKGAQDYLVKGEVGPRMLVRIIHHAIERRRTEEALKKERTNLQTMFDMINVGMLLVDEHGAITRVNDTMSRWAGKDLSLAIGSQPGNLLGCINAGADAALCGTTAYCTKCPIRRAFEAALHSGKSVHGVEAEVNLNFGGKNVRLWIEVSADPVMMDGKRHAILAITNITTRRHVEQERAISLDFLRLLNECGSMGELVSAATTFFQAQSACQAVGVRLQEGDDFPYYEARGFPQEFLQLENELCLRDAHQNVMRDEVGNPVIACMCGNVICGRTDPSQHFFTAQGSFWTNSTTELLASTSEANRQARTRNRCNGEGYESVALIPLRIGEERLGLLQLNDRRTGMFSLEAINLWERLAGYLAVALARLRSKERLQSSVRRFELLAHSANQLLQASQPQEVVNNLCRSVMEHLDCHVFFNYLTDPADNRLRLNAYAGIAKEEAKRIEWLDYGTAVCGCAARDGRRIVAEHIQTSLDPRTDLVKGYGVQAYAAHPLLGHRGEVLGTLSFGAKTRHTFSTDDLDMMKAVTDQVAVAIARLRGEEELAKAKVQADSANKAKSIFLANMSHEIRTPLGGILGFSDLLAEPGLAAAERTQFSEIITRCGTQLSAIIDDVLDLSRVESGQLQMEIRRVSLSRLLDDVRHVVAVKAEAKGVSFHIHKGWIPEGISSDVIRLQQILTNVIGNAIKFTPTGGEVTLHVDTDHEKHAIVFTITDTGIGIAPENHEKIFRPFTQAERGTTRKFGGTGLGLTLSRNLAHALGGDLVLRESTPGKGSTFAITISAVGSDEAWADAEPTEYIRDPNHDELQGLDVLLAEDTEMIAILVRRLLGSRGARVDVVENGRDAIKQALAKNYHAILMGIRMPVMDGLTATKMLRSQGYRRPIIALTANALQEERDASLAAGCTAHLSKPINMSELIGILGRQH